MRKFIWGIALALVALGMVLPMQAASAVSEPEVECGTPAVYEPDTVIPAVYEPDTVIPAVYGPPTVIPAVYGPPTVVPGELITPAQDAVYEVEYLYTNRPLQEVPENGREERWYVEGEQPGGFVKVVPEQSQPGELITPATEAVYGPDTVVPGALITPEQVIPGALITPEQVIPGALVTPEIVIPGVLITPAGPPCEEPPCAYDFPEDEMWEVTWGHGFEDRNGGLPTFTMESYGGLVALNEGPVPAYMTEGWQWLYVTQANVDNGRTVIYDFADDTRIIATVSDDGEGCPVIEWETTTVPADPTVIEALPTIDVVDECGTANDEVAISESEEYTSSVEGTTVIFTAVEGFVFPADAEGITEGGTILMTFDPPSEEQCGPGPKPEPEPQPEPEPKTVDHDCADFATQAQAQVAYEAGETDLDGDGDGVACEFEPVIGPTSATPTGLPNTGGPNTSMVMLGAVLLFAGGGLLLASRRRVQKA